MSFRIAVDAGGTFTDVAVSGKDGRLVLGKSPTTRDRIFEGLRAGLEMAAEQIGLPAATIVQRCDLFVYATTHATNAMLTGHVAKTAFLTTKGFPDTLVLRQGGKQSAYDFTQQFPAPYIPRRLTFEIDERVDTEGGVVAPLDEAATRTVLKLLGDQGVEAVAVSLINAVANPVHEQAAGRLIEELLPGVPYTLSSALNPIVGEYPRSSSAAIDASIKPLMQRHLLGVRDDLRAAGFAGELLVASSSGGTMHLEDLVERPIYTLKSGPSLAPVAGREYGSGQIGSEDIVVADTGGTSFDVSLLRAGRIKFTRDTWLGPKYTGHLTGLSSVDIRSVGAGGGSIAWIDPGGLLRVGPESAGADPGPACYGRGGERPTVTDAAVVLGYIDPDFFLGGRMRIDVDAARRVLAPLAAELGESLERTAFGVITVASELMVLAIQDITISEGVDPRESLVVAGGGAAGLNIGPIGRELGCRRVLIPRTSGAFSACGGQFSDVVSETWRSHEFLSASGSVDAVNAVLDGIDAELDDIAQRLRDRGFTRFQRQYLVEARYPGQFWDLEVELDSPRLKSDADVESLRRAVGAAHERVFAVAGEGDVECLVWKGRLTAKVERRTPGTGAVTTQSTPEPYRTRTGYFGDDRARDVPVFLGDSLAPGNRIAGPALILEPTTTIVVYPGSDVELTSEGHYLMELG
ncbi:N-methylhydantoinase A [Kibdelosporangium banguiense]|uniref:N-methylhydantoinase A n=1 Tax=Kibdelosporangium banguiense TaxID=1365924 RepID=A0ABS4TY16_9PSEU|nr:hydantoinase/oxoprolinase family protein [Kibdelosporangium banguiense]MBP2329271.1 N-methylhydantoinase A [Kibdelosporangium banguiense]